LPLLHRGDVTGIICLQRLDSDLTVSTKIAELPRVFVTPLFGEGEAIPLEEGRRLQPAVSLFPVGGVRPDWWNIVSGRYPLRDPVYLVARRPSPLESLLRRVVVKADPAPAVAEAFASEEGRGALCPVEKTISLAAVGDIMLSRGIAGYMREFGVEYPVSLVESLLSSRDLTFANLESPMGVTGKPLPGKMIWFRAEPRAVECLARAGVDIVTLANNHTMDYGPENLLETMAILDSKGISHTGAGRDIAESRRPAILERKGIKVAFLGYNEFADASLYWDAKNPRTLLAGPGTPGTAPIDMGMIAEDVARAKDEADVVVVSFHWGQEYVNHPRAYFDRDLRQIARGTIDLGADLVLGFHPHAVQGIEIYRNKPIAYSLGNFIMDQERPIARESMIALFDLSRDGVEYMEVIPAMIEKGRPRPLDGADARALLQKLRSISRDLQSD
jgi:poly-gamma-glutamate synthesis protein (capsule biosynthesis protein)